MRVLLDTHALLWFVDGSANLSNTAQGLIANPANRKVVSIVSLWEIAIKYGLGRLTLSLPLSDFINIHLTPASVEMLSIEIKHVLQFASLPHHHRDPFDRLLIARTQAEKIPVISADVAFDAYTIQCLWN